MIKNLYSHNIKAEGKSARHVINIFGIKIKYKTSNYLHNAKLCETMGIKTLLFIRNDGIGDFLFNLPYIEYIKKSKKYGKYKIIFMGTSENIMLAKKYMPQYIDDYIFVEYGHNKKEVKNFKKMSFDTIINPIDAKINKLTESIIKVINAREKICHMGYFAKSNLDTHNDEVREILEKYTHIIDTGSNIMFVKDRCKIFFEKLLEEKLPNIKPLCEISKNEPDIKSDYIIISAFARGGNRVYSPDNYAKIIDFITTELDIPVVLIGNPREEAKAEKIRSSCLKPEMVYNLAGKISLNEVILYIKMAKMLIANETGTVHLAQNNKLRTICICNGSYMGTFQPYPKEESYVSYIYPDGIHKYLDENQLYGDTINYDINQIDYKKVIKVIKEVLNEKETV